MARTKQAAHKTISGRPFTESVSESSSVLSSSSASDSESSSTGNLYGREHTVKIREEAVLKREQAVTTRESAVTKREQAQATASMSTNVRVAAPPHFLRSGVGSAVFTIPGARIKHTTRKPTGGKAPARPRSTTTLSQSALTGAVNATRSAKSSKLHAVYAYDDSDDSDTMGAQTRTKKRKRGEADHSASTDPILKIESESEVKQEIDDSD